MARLFTGAEVLDDWNPLDGVPAPEFVPPEWTGPHVGVRLADAWRVLSKMPIERITPRAYGRCWPQYRHEWEDLLAMVGAELEAMQREVNRVRILPTAKEISRMEQAMAWPVVFLKAARQVLIVHVCARIASFDGDLDREIRRRRYGGSGEQWQKLNWDYCDSIADGLIEQRVMVF